MRFVALVFALLAVSPASAEPLLHPMFADHAVLQRDQPIRVYGQAPAGSDIRVQLGPASATAHALPIPRLAQVGPGSKRHARVSEE